MTKLKKQQLVDALVAGNELIESLKKDYFRQRGDPAFNPNQFLSPFQQRASIWAKETTLLLERLFDTPQQAIRFKNAQASALYQSGTNVKWGSLVNHVEAKLRALDSTITLCVEPVDLASPTPSSSVSNPEITSGLEKFRADYRGKRTAFIMMQLARTKAHGEIVASLKEALAPHGILGLRADDKQYMDDLFPNVKVYMHGCDFGIAVFERITADNFNPNVSLEVGYMIGMRKDVLLLKDSTLKSLPTDLTGRLYREFDTQDISRTVPGVIEKWLSDKGLIK